ncbi:NUDIX hydrolase [Microbacterium sp.]|uniref:NUDIX hydrolase n=1 Tax=Microbacterium sp. TaxID=51671 RepID=UPI0028AE9941|nr:NUDIX hydrolase [Microbacterium sp.]
MRAVPAETRAVEDGWADGRYGAFWGRYGAAGVLIQNIRGEVLLQLRASWCHHPGTWGIPGGARESGESALDAALRECREEHGFPADDLTVIGAHTLDFGYWSYVTFVARYPSEWPVSIRTAEADDARWIPLAAMPLLPLHPGLAGTWRHLREILQTA